MEGIEISFPLTVCQDILGDNSENQRWYVYQASISPWEKNGKKTLGSLRARVVPSVAEKLIDLVLTFPRNTIKYPAVKGHLRCRVENIKSVSENEPGKSTSTTSRSTSNQKKTELKKSSQQENPIRRESGGDDTTLGKPSSDASLDILPKRPSRRREKPSRYKDYVVITDLPQSQKPGKTDVQDAVPTMPKTDSVTSSKPSKSETCVNEKAFDHRQRTDLTNQSEEMGVITQKIRANRDRKSDSFHEAESQNREPHLHTTPIKNQNTNNEIYDLGNDTKSPFQTKQNTHEMMPLATQKSSERKQRTGVGKYNRLIKSLQEASEKTGQEMLSIVPRLTSDTDSEFRKTIIERPGTNDSSTFQNTSVNVKITKPTSYAAQESNKSGCTDPENMQQTQNGTSSLANHRSGLTSVTLSNSRITSETCKTSRTHSASEPTLKTSQYFTSFPRKFPSSLIRDSVMDVSYRKRPLTAPHVETVSSKSRKIQSTKKSLDCKNVEENVDGVPLEEYGIESEQEFSKMNRLTVPREQNRTSVDLNSGVRNEGQPDRTSSTGLPSTPASTSQGLPTFQGQKDDSVLGPDVASSLKMPASAEQTGLTRMDKSGPGTSSTLTPVPAGNGDNASRPLQLTISASSVQKVTGDHDYHKGAWNSKNMPRALKTLVKPISYAQHISAKVERVEEGEGSSLVTISGLNRKALPPNLLPALRHNYEGLPIAECLEDAMTDTHRRRLNLMERYQQATTTEPCTAVMMDINDIPVVSEVTINPSGHQRAAFNSHRSLGGHRRRPRKHYPPLPKTTVQYVMETENLSEAGMVMDEKRTDRKDMSNSIILEMSQFGSEEVHSLVREEVTHNELTHTILQECSGQDLVENAFFPGDEQSLSQDCLDRGWIGARFLPGEEVTVDEITQHQLDADVTVDNENEVKNSQKPLLGRFCQYCLKMFLGPLMLYKHVKSVHAAYSNSPEHQDYLQALKHGSRAVCPYCPGRHVLSNEYKLRSHLINFHGNQVADLEDMISNAVRLRCEVCQVHFHTLSELKAHATLLHNTDVSECVHCPSVFVREESRGVHMSQAHGDHSCRSFACKMCNGCFDNEQDLNAHKQVHGKSLRQQAKAKSSTGAKVKRKWGRRAGYASGDLKTSKEDIKCPCCADQFPTFWQLQEHCHEAHTGPISTHCIFCGQGFHSLSEMNQHLLSHLQADNTGSGALLLHCPYCKLTTLPHKSFLLVSHITKKHSVQFPHKCHVCQQSFQQEKALSVHYMEAHEFHSANSQAKSLLPSSNTAANFTETVTLPSIAPSVGNMSESPAQAKMKSDIFVGLSAEAQSKLQDRIELITKCGKKALVTIKDGKGDVQQVTFRPTQSASLAQIPAIPDLSFPSDHLEGDQLEEYSDTVAAETMAMNVAEMPTSSETVECGMDFPMETDVAEETEVTTSATVEAALGAAGFGTDSEVTVGSEGMVEGAEFLSETTIGTDSSDLLVLPHHIVYMKDGEEKSLDLPELSEGGADVIDTSEMSVVTMETEDGETVLLSADDFLKLFKDFPTVTGANSAGPSH